MASSLESALQDLTLQDVPNIRRTAKSYEVAETTLRDRFKGKSVSRQEYNSTSRQKLTDVQENALIRQINKLTDRGMPPTVRMVRNFAEEIISGPVGKNWTASFVRRHKKSLKSLYLQNMDSNRVKSEYSPSYKLFYDLLQEAIEKYNITGENIYNWDEKGFLIGMASRIQRIMTLQALESGRITHATQDGNREFISLLACICGDGTSLPPALIYKGESQVFQDTWLEELGMKDEAFFATSTNGWSSDEMGRNWLDQVFDRCTREKANNRRRLLIVDGHFSHVNMQFILRCDKLRILLLILPSHSTHRLQPLDVGLFSPLATYYIEGLNEIMFNSLGATRMTKRMFWSVFIVAWKKAFINKNIESAFKKTGIFSYNPQLILDVITKPSSIEVSESVSSLKISLISRSIRNMHKAYIKAPSQSVFIKILHANERLAAEHSIDQHTIKGLTEGLRNEKKRRERGKRLNLLGEEGSGPQFFSPGKVQAARDRLEAKETEKAQKQQDSEGKKALAAAAKKQKEETKAERMRKALEKKMLSAELRVKKMAEMQVQKDLKNRASEMLGGGSSSINVTSEPSLPENKGKNKGSEVVVSKGVDEVKAVNLTTARGRRVQRPRKFDF